MLALALGAWLLAPDRASALWERLRPAGAGSKPEALTRAEQLFREGRSLEEQGHLAHAYRRYTGAVESYSQETRYYWALISIADRVQRREEVREHVRRYLDRRGARDPGGMLSRWLEERQ